MREVHPFLVFRSQLTHVGVFGGGESSVGSLGASEAELQQADVLAGRHPVPGRVGRHQTDIPAAQSGGRVRGQIRGHTPPAEIQPADGRQWRGQRSDQGSHTTGRNTAG